MTETTKEPITVIDEPTWFEDMDLFLSNLVRKLRLGPTYEEWIKTATIEQKRQFVSKVRKLLEDRSQPGDADSVQSRVGLKDLVERLLGTEFKSTKDFRQKVDAYLEGYDGRQLPVSKRLMRARKKLKLSQKQLAGILGYKDHVCIAQFESGKRSPSRRVLQWLEQAGM